jgi:hypothetical protein
VVRDFAAGRRAARNKIASYLKRNGIHVQSSRDWCPPTDDDFLDGIKQSFDTAGWEQGTVMVVFKFWQSEYQIVLPVKKIEILVEDPKRRQLLFTASSPGGWNTFLLGQEDGGNLVVYRKKRWRAGKLDELEIIPAAILSR